MIKSTLKFSLVFAMSMAMLNISQPLTAQVNNTDASAILNLESTDQGVLIPRMSTSERDNIVSPAIGLMVYNIDDNTFSFYNGTAWLDIGSNSDNDWTINGNNMYSSVSGSVGIGTTNPTQKLDVNGPAKIQNLQFTNSLIYVPNDDLRLIGGGPQTTRSHIELPNNGGINLNAEANKFILLNNGKVGIGTTNPTQKLDVNGPAKIQNLQLTNSLIYVPNDDLRLIGGGPQTTRSHIELPNNGGINLNAGVNKFILLNNGHVGIGTSNPGELLDINGAIHLEPGSPPTTPNEGDIYMDSSTHKLRCYDGTTWRDLW